MPLTAGAGCPAHDFLIRIVVSNCFSYMFTGWFLLLLSWKTAGKVTKNNLNPLSGPVLFPMKVFHVPPSCPRPAGNAGRRRLFPSVGNAVPRQLGMPFPGSRECGSRTVGNLRFSVSRTVYGELSHTEARRTRRAGRVGHLRCGERFRSTGRSGGDAESCLKFLSIHLTEDPDLQDAGRVHR